MEEGIEIGHGVVIRFTTRYDHDDDLAIGLHYWHDRPDGGGRCQGFVFFDIPEVEPYRAGSARDGWQVESTDPLTLSPSLLCRSCGHHGFIRGGAWVPA
jgi:hypothetical protein